MSTEKVEVAESAPVTGMNNYSNASSVFFEVMNNDHLERNGSMRLFTLNEVFGTNDYQEFLRHFKSDMDSDFNDVLCEKGWFNNPVGFYSNLINPVSTRLHVFRNTFESRFPIMKGFDYHNVVVAGGACVCSLSNQSPIPLGDNPPDIDIFFYKMNPSDASMKVSQITNWLAERCRRITVLHNSKYHLSILGEPFPDPITGEEQPTFKVQLMYRIYGSVNEILYGFDVGACSVAYNGQDVFFSTLAKFAYQAGFNIYDTSRKSTTYEKRLSKYCTKYGFGIAFPHINVDAEVPVRPSRDYRKYPDKYVVYKAHLNFRTFSISLEYHYTSPIDIPLQGNERREQHLANLAEQGVLDQYYQWLDLLPTTRQIIESARCWYHRFIPQFQMGSDYNDDGGYFLTPSQINRHIIYSYCYYNESDPDNRLEYAIYTVINRVTHLEKCNFNFDNVRQQLLDQTQKCMLQHVKLLSMCQAFNSYISVFPNAGMNYSKQRWLGQYELRVPISKNVPVHHRKLFDFFLRGISFLLKCIDGRAISRILYNSELGIIPRLSEIAKIEDESDMNFQTRQLAVEFAQSIEYKIIEFCSDLSWSPLKINWLTENPGTQITASFNPTIENPADFFPSQLYRSDGRHESASGHHEITSDCVSSENEPSSAEPPCEVGSAPH